MAGNGIAPPAPLAVDIDVLNAVAPFVGATAQSFGHGGGGANRNVVLARGTAKDEPDNLRLLAAQGFSSGNSTYQRWLGLGRPAEGKRAHLLDSHRHRVAHAVVAGWEKGEPVGAGAAHQLCVVFGVDAFG